MLTTLRSLNSKQKEAVIDLLVLAACFCFLLGYLANNLTQPKVTWSEVITAMPYGQRQAVAIDFCEKNRRWCRTFPASK
jgi:hypothetical protein